MRHTTGNTEKRNRLCSWAESWKNSCESSVSSLSSISCPQRKCGAVQTTGCFLAFDIQTQGRPPGGQDEVTRGGERKAYDSPVFHWEGPIDEPAVLRGSRRSRCSLRCTLCCSNCSDPLFPCCSFFILQWSIESTINNSADSLHRQKNRIFSPLFAASCCLF